MTAAQLQEILNCATSKAILFCDPLNITMLNYKINTTLRQSAFIAQVGHESGRLQYVRELASGKAYEGRKDLGNIDSGDGVKFKGRGLIQITGRTNYKLCGDALNLDLINHPELLELPINTALSAGWFWYTRKLNALADKPDFKKITRVINGGLNGESEREAFYQKALTILQG